MTSKNRQKKPKILQVSVQDGEFKREFKIDEQTITVGKDIENTLSLANLSYKERLSLFEKEGNRFNLVISNRLSNIELSVNGSTLLADDLIKHNLLRKRSDNVYIYPISNNCIGRLSIDGILFKFSLVDPPVPPPVPTIPKEFRRKLIVREDAGFINILILSIAIHLTFVVIFERTALKKHDIGDIKKVPKRFAKLILGVTQKQLKEINKPKPEKKKKKEEVKKEEEKKEEKKKEEEKKEKKKEEQKTEKKPKETKVAKKEDAPKKPKVDERTKRRERLKTKGVLAMLAGRRAGGGAKTVSHFIQNKSLSQNIDKVLTSLGGLQNIKPTLNKKKKDEKAVGIDNLIAKVSEEEKSKVKSVKLKERKRANVKELFDMEGSGAGNPKRSKAVLSSVVQTYIGGLKYLYDRELRKDPTLEGKVVIQFVILANGKVTNCQVIKTTMNNRRFENSLIKRIRRWQFEPIEEGEVIITYPFIFFPVISG